MQWYVSLHSSSQKLKNSKPYNQHILCSVTWLSALLNMMCCPDIDHLTRILVLCGTPGKETVAKITSEEVMAFSYVSIKGSQIHLNLETETTWLSCQRKSYKHEPQLWPTCVVMNNVKNQKSLYEIQSFVPVLECVFSGTLIEHRMLTFLYF